MKAALALPLTPGGDWQHDAERRANEAVLDIARALARRQALYDHLQETKAASDDQTRGDLR